MRKIKRLVDYIHISEERDIYNRSMGLNLTGHLPLLTTKVNRDAALKRKKYWEAFYPFGETRWYHQRGSIAEYAFHRLLGKRIFHKWTEYSLQSPDFIIYSGGKPITVDVHSSRHRQLMQFEDNPYMKYPIRRLLKHAEIPEYVLATSVFGLTSEEQLVAFWGVITHDRLIKVMREKWGNKPIPTGNQYVEIPLVEFLTEPLAKLLK